MQEFHANETVRTRASPHVKLKSCNKLLGVTPNKSKIMRFLMSQWRKKALRGKLSNRIVYVAAEDHCIDAGTCDLKCNHEEADTTKRLTRVWFFLPITQRARALVIHADDFIFLLVLSQSLCRCYLKRRSRAKTRI